ncbi:hypothetical protein GX51_00380, partial [Blastomyces parvus]
MASPVDKVVKVAASRGWGRRRGETRPGAFLELKIAGIQGKSADGWTKRKPEVDRKSGFSELN